MWKKFHAKIGRDAILTVVIVADEQERVQKKTFVNWINSYLSKVIHHS